MKQLTLSYLPSGAWHIVGTEMVITLTLHYLPSGEVCVEEQEEGSLLSKCVSEMLFAFFPEGPRLPATFLNF